MSAASARLDAELVRRGLARSRGRAAALVAQGRVRVGDVVARKASQPVPEAAALSIVPDEATEYVSRAAHKLAGALDAINALAPGALQPAGARCLDAGASTGGFTQVLREGVNVRRLSPQDVGGPVDLVVADLSFISLTVVLPALVAAVAPGGNLLLMVKPQFEIGRQRLGASGVVTSPALREEAVRRVAEAATGLGCTARAVVPSGLPGPAGNHEYFLWLTPGSASSADGTGLGDAAAQSVRDAVRLAVRDDVAALVGAATVRSIR